MTESLDEHTLLGTDKTKLNKRTKNGKNTWYEIHSLFEFIWKITRVRTQHCFGYNSTIVYLVPRQEIAKSIGESGKNIKKLSQILEKKVKVIAIPSGIEDIRRFILSIIYPVKFKSIEIKENNITISAGMQSKAALIGRNKTRLSEMKKILEQYFGIKDVRIAWDRFKNLQINLLM